MKTLNCVQGPNQLYSGKKGRSPRDVSQVSVPLSADTFTENMNWEHIKWGHGEVTGSEGGKQVELCGYNFKGEVGCGPGRKEGRRETE